MSQLIYHIFLLWFSPRLVLTQDEEYPGKIDCYGWTGRVFPNNTQCPGSQICCQTADLCDPNRFCLQNNQIIVPACAVFPWNNCANICQYDTGTGFLPRVVECSDGSFCCDNDPPCCSENRGIVLNGLGAIVSTDGGTSTSSSSTLTSSSTIATTTSLSSPTTTSATPTNTPTSSADDSGSSSSSSTGLSTGAKAGIGVAAAIAVIAIITLVALLIRSHRRQAKPLQSSQQSGDPKPADDSISHPQFASAYSVHSQPSELAETKPQLGRGLYELPGQSGSRI